MGYTREFEIDRSESLEYVFSLCSDAPYERESKQFGVYDEVLVISEESVDFSRLNSGACAFLRDHDPEKVLGVIVKAWIDGNKVKCKVKFSDREDVQEVVRDIQAGIMTCTSVGYTIDKYHFSTENGKKTMYADRFMIYEGSLVGVPADISVGFNRSLDREEHEMQRNEPKEKPEEKAEETPEGQKKVRDILRKIKAKGANQHNIRYIMDKLKGRSSSGGAKNPSQHKNTTSGRVKKKKRPY